MIPGPYQMIACPFCKGLAKYMTLTSGNTFGGRIWSDGKQVYPMLPQPPEVVKCSHCGESYWLAEAEKVGTVDPWQRKDQKIDPAWAAAQEVQEPAVKDYYRALAKGLAANPEQEKTLRILAWWRGNDAFRDAGKEKTSPFFSWLRRFFSWWRRNDISNDAGKVHVTEGAIRTRENLEALTRLFDDGDENDRLMKAEVLRELGEFEAAKQVLNSIESPGFSEIVDQLQKLCDRRDPTVKELRVGV